MTAMPLVRGLLVAAVFLAPLANANVRLVDSTGAPGTFTTIQAACDQSADGDVVLVRSGTYAAFALVNKGITVANYPGAIVHVSGGIRIRNLAAGKSASLLGLEVQGISGGATNTEHGLVTSSDHGPVRCENCRFVAALSPSTSTGDGAAGAVVDACDDVAFSHCRCSGGASAAIWKSTTSAGAGLSATASAVTVFDSVLAGGFGAAGDPTYWDGGSGGHAYLGLDSTLFASKTEFDGGNGGNGLMGAPFCDATQGGYGGNALRLQSAGDLVRLVSSTEVPGRDGDSYGDFCGYFPGAWAPTRVANGGTFVDLPVAGRSMNLAQNPVREGTPIVASLVGIPGDPVALIVSFNTAAQFNPAWNGNQMFPLLATTRFLVVGTVPSGGTLTYSMTLPDLGPGVASRLYYFQPLFGTSSNQRVLGTSVPMLALDAGL